MCVPLPEICVCKMPKMLKGAHHWLRTEETNPFVRRNHKYFMLLWIICAHFFGFGVRAIIIMKLTWLWNNGMNYAPKQQKTGCRDNAIIDNGTMLSVKSYLNHWNVFARAIRRRAHTHESNGINLAWCCCCCCWCRLWIPNEGIIFHEHRALIHIIQTECCS